VNQQFSIAPELEPEHHLDDPFGWYARHEEIERQRALRREKMLRRLRWLLAGSLLAFSGVTWLLVRHDGAWMSWLGLSGPSRVVRQHLEALNRGEARAAYEFFSQKYRREIPLGAYEQMVATHWAMFRTRVLSMQAPSQTDGHAVLEMRLASSTGDFYVARFTLVRIEGHWWIDQIRWSLAAHPNSFTRT
jgi:hypothetical protein